VSSGTACCLLPAACWLLFAWHCVLACCCLLCAWYRVLAAACLLLCAACHVLVAAACRLPVCCVSGLLLSCAHVCFHVPASVCAGACYAGSLLCVCLCGVHWVVCEVVREVRVQAVVYYCAPVSVSFPLCFVYHLLSWARVWGFGCLVM
jgi:hypothetical protein